MRRWIVVMAVLSLAVWGCGGEPTADGAQVASGAEGASTVDTGDTGDTGEPTLPFRLTDRQASGRIVYENLCWTCHGAAGRGDGPAVLSGSVDSPPDFHSPAFPSLDVEALAQRFEEAMEGPDEDHPHMRFITTLVRPDRFRDALAYIPALTYPEEIPGSALAGQTRYGNLCVGCHGPRGEGNGEAASLMAVQPASFPTDTLLSRGDFQGVFERIKHGAGRTHGSSMPPWGAMLDDDQIWDLVAYVATFHPASLSEPPTGSR